LAGMAAKSRKKSALQGGSRESREAILEQATAMMQGGGRGGPPERSAPPAARREDDGPESYEDLSVEDLRKLDDDELDGVLDRVADLLHRVDEAFPGELEQFVASLEPADAREQTPARASAGDALRKVRAP
jgi:hypothetical protein